jgi:DNA-binding transcriptional MerR regulator
MKGQDIEEPSLSIADVSKRTGIATASLRAWERRYGFPVPHRTSGGHRRYTEDQVERLTAAHALLEQGWAAGSAVRRVLEDGGAASTKSVQTASAAPQPETPAPGSGGEVDADLLLLINRTMHDLIRMTAPAMAVDILVNAVEVLGGSVVDAANADAATLPIDLSMGETDPILVNAEPFTLARMRIESSLPRLVESAQVLVDRLRAVRAS